MAGWIGQNPMGVAQCRDRSRARGVTLIEVMLAASILALMVLALFEGIAVSARIARENAEYLQADAYAFDLAWKRYNESYAVLRNFVSTTSSERTFDEEITEEAAPMLYRAGSSAVSHTTITRITNPADASVELGLLITVDVEWGSSNSRHRLSSTHTAKVFKSGSEDG
jgi:type II secretory pathway pseudopilin PulG